MSTASKTFTPITLAELAAKIERRRSEAGVSGLPRNSGKRRTPGKKALLKAIRDAGGKW